MRGNVKRIVAGVLVVALLISAAVSSGTKTPGQAAIKGTLNKKKVTIATGKSTILKVKKKGSVKVTFTSSKKEVAKVSDKGKVIGLKKGKATITAKLKKGNKTKKLKCKVTVVQGAKSLKVLGNRKKKVTKIDVVKFDTVKLTAKISPKKSNDIVTWTSSDTDIVTVKNGEITGQYVGKTNIYAKTYSGKKVKIKVTVKAPALDKTLKEAYQNIFKIGAAVNSWQLEGKGNYDKAKKLITSQFDSITMENQMKPDALLSETTKTQGDENSVILNTASLDAILKLARENNLKLRGHCLVWHSQTPEWFFHQKYDEKKDYVSKAILRQRMHSYISQILAYCQENYPGVVYAWDVVNEAMEDDGTPRKTSNWYKIYGNTDYITDAFTFAREYAAEGVSLFYNDYNEYMPAKRDAIQKLVKKLYDDGVCDGIGMQSHHTMSYPTTALVKVAIQRYNSIAPGRIQIQLTELDIHNTNKTAKSHQKVADKYEDLFKMLVLLARDSGVNITNVTFWGLTDADTWLSGFRGETSYPMLFGGDYAAKTAYFSVIQAAGIW
ncbi:MAG: endo-1,4-beta-xylanase [Lachnospiraceae bacterium]|nr:endo-1,4-beta-xylanase [Lachnospiraceae bacterium]